AALYRAGRFEEAQRRFEEAQKDHTPVAWDWLFLAMIQHRLGHSGEAHRCLEKANAWIEQADLKASKGDPRGGWANWCEHLVEIPHLKREAEALIVRKGAAAAPAKPR